MPRRARAAAMIRVSATGRARARLVIRNAAAAGQLLLSTSRPGLSPSPTADSGGLHHNNRSHRDRDGSSRRGQPLAGPGVTVTETRDNLKFKFKSSQVQLEVMM